MDKFFIVIFCLGTVSAILFTVIALKGIIQRSSCNDLILRLIPSQGHGIKKALSSSWYIMLLNIYIISKLVIHFELLNLAVIIFLTFGTVWIFVDELAAIEFRERGVFSKYRFIPWEKIKGYKVIEKQFKDRIPEKNYIIEYGTKKFRIYSGIYNDNGAIEKVLKGHC